MTLDELRETLNNPLIPGNIEVKMAYWVDRDNPDGGDAVEKSLRRAEDILRISCDRDRLGNPIKERVFLLS